jgi:hypothetical protein
VTRLEVKNTGGEGRFLLLPEEAWDRAQLAVTAEAVAQAAAAAPPPPPMDVTCDNLAPAGVQHPWQQPSRKFTSGSSIYSSSTASSAGWAHTARAHWPDRALAALLELAVADRDNNNNSPAGAAAASATTTAAVTAAAAAGGVTYCSSGFSLRPSLLELGQGQSEVLEIMFEPAAPGPAAATLVVVCDNCTTSILTLHGEGAEVGVTIAALDGRPVQQSDLIAPLWLGKVPVGCATQRTVTVRNNSQLGFAFCWRVCNTGGAGALQASQQQQQQEQLPLPWIQEEEDDGESQKIKQEENPHNNNNHNLGGDAISILPTHGVLSPGQDHDITIEFAPRVIAQHAASLKLLLQLPRSMRGGDERQPDLVLPGMANSSGSDGATTGDDSSVESQTVVSAAAAATRATGATGTAIAATATEATEAIAGASTHWLAVGQLTCEGVGVPLVLRPEPGELIEAPGQLVVGDVFTAQLLLHNASPAAAHFCFDACVEAAQPDLHRQSGRQTDRSADDSSSAASASRVAVVSVQPACGAVPGGGCARISISLHASTPGQHSGVLVCRVRDGQPLRLYTRATVTPPAVRPSTLTLDLGLVREGLQASHMLTLTNSAVNCSADWVLEQHHHWQQQPLAVAAAAAGAVSKDTHCVVCSPCSGMLLPGASAAVAITAHGGAAGTHELLLRLQSRCCVTEAGSSGWGGQVASREQSHMCYLRVLITIVAPQVVLDVNTYVVVELKPSNSAVYLWLCVCVCDCVCTWNYLGASAPPSFPGSACIIRLQHSTHVYMHAVALLPSLHMAAVLRC